MPHREQLAFLRQCEAEAVERGHEAKEPAEQDLHFGSAAEYAAQIMAIEKQRLA